jgi:hypothetical protein
MNRAIPALVFSASVAMAGFVGDAVPTTPDMLRRIVTGFFYDQRA